MLGTNQKGTVQSFFTFWSGSSSLPWSLSEWEELDIEIVPSKAPNSFYTNIIFTG